MNARERSRVETRRRLIEKGTELFSTKGIAATRAVDIARAAAVAVGTLYLHFKDKQGLLRAILFEGVEELLESLRGLASVPLEDVTKAVRAHTELMVRFAEEHTALCRILFDPESVRSNVSIEITEYLVSMQEKRLREGVDQGVFPHDMDIRVASHASVGMLINVLDWWTKNPEQADRRTVIDTLTRLRVGLYRV